MTHIHAEAIFVAVSSTGPAAPVLGAARASLTDAEWQGKVLEWMKLASMIVVVAGTTHWLQWELSQIVNRGYTNKLIILFTMTNTLNRFQVVRNAFHDSAWDACLGDVRGPMYIRGLIFNQDGHVTEVTARSDR